MAKTHLRTMILRHPKPKPKPKPRAKPVRIEAMERWHSCKTSPPPKNTLVIVRLPFVIPLPKDDHIDRSNDDWDPIPGLKHSYVIGFVEDNNEWTNTFDGDAISSNLSNIYDSENNSKEINIWDNDLWLKNAEWCPIPGITATIKASEINNLPEETIPMLDLMLQLEDDRVKQESKPKRRRAA
jgi:hypothetical protein